MTVIVGFIFTNHNSATFVCKMTHVLDEMNENEWVRLKEKNFPDNYSHKNMTLEVPPQLQHAHHKDCVLMLEGKAVEMY